MWWLSVSFIFSMFYIVCYSVDSFHMVYYCICTLLLIMPIVSQSYILFFITVSHPFPTAMSQHHHTNGMQIYLPAPIAETTSSSSLLVAVVMARGNLSGTARMSLIGGLDNKKKASSKSKHMWVSNFNTVTEYTVCLWLSLIVC